MGKVTRKQSEERLIQVVEQITESPEIWDQGEWHTECGTSHCFGGFCDLNNPDVEIPLLKDKNDLEERMSYNEWAGRTPQRAADWLGFEEYQVEDLFDGENNITDIVHQVNLLLEKIGSKKRIALKSEVILNA